MRDLIGRCRFAGELPPLFSRTACQLEKLSLSILRGTAPRSLSAKRDASGAGGEKPATGVSGRCSILHLLSSILFFLLAAPAAAQVPAGLPADSLRPEPIRDTVVTPDTLPLLTPEEVAARVLAENPTVAIARLDRAIAENDYSIGNAGFLPTAGLTATQRRTPSRETTPGGPAFENTTLDVVAGVDVPVFEGLSRFARYERLGVLAEQEALSADATAEATLADALVLYYDVAGQQQQIAVLREAVAISEERLRIATGRRDVGAASDLEVRRALVDLNADRAALLRQEAALARSKALLNEYLNRPAGLDYRASDSTDIQKNLALDALEADALADAPALRAAERGVEAAELEQTAIRREVWPRVSLSAGYAFSELTDPLLAPGQTGGLTVGLSASLPIFDAFERRRRTDNAGLRIQQQTLAAERTRTAFLTGLRSTYALYERSLLLVELEEENVEAARQNVAVALERFRLGASTSVELREVQRALTDAQSRLVRARFEAKQAEIDLRALSGRLLGE